jgi:hypothetical protein
VGFQVSKDRSSRIPETAYTSIALASAEKVCGLTSKSVATGYPAQELREADFPLKPFLTSVLTSPPPTL